MKSFLLAIGLLCLGNAMLQAQNFMTPETMLTLNRMSVVATAPAQDFVLYRTSKTNLDTEKSDTQYYMLNLKTGVSTLLSLGGKSVFQWDKNGMYAKDGETLYVSGDMGNTWNTFYKTGKIGLVKVSPDAKYVAYSKEVQVNTVLGKEKYENWANTTAKIYDDLQHRHWDTWSDGKYNHLFVAAVAEPVERAKNLFEGKQWNTPQKPFGGAEDFVWSGDSQALVYVLKPKSGREFMTSTNTDLFAYFPKSGATQNLTEANHGYDVHPVFSPDGKKLLWAAMKRDGYEADKNDLMVMDWASRQVSNVTEGWDESVTGDIQWSSKGDEVYFTSAMRGTRQLFAANVKSKAVRQITSGNHDVNAVVATGKDAVWVSRSDINHNGDIYKVNVKNGAMTQVTDVNKAVYAGLKPATSELKMIDTHDGQSMGVWFHYPPDFDPTKKYPTLLYCQGGPQSALTQYFSTRWNFAVMTGKGYIVVAPNRRGMQGWGVKWNEAISKDWGGGAIQDYLSAADYAKTLNYVDGDRMAAVGASYGGYSVYMLAGLHENRFASFIAHNGLYDMQSWYGTTEELFFANWDAGSPWEDPQPLAYTKFNPSTYVQNWDTPILIIQGQLDYRVAYEQGQQAFQAARLHGVKARFLYFEDENHWVLKPHNALVWQNEFFRWLEETMPKQK
ncbi:MAG: S9 family peptidase [Weeksellaceae bacterium]|nr:S9 family peptidase [Weeksellaceae bacterium]